MKSLEIVQFEPSLSQIDTDAAVKAVLKPKILLRGQNGELFQLNLPKARVPVVTPADDQKKEVVSVAGLIQEQFNTDPALQLRAVAFSQKVSFIADSFGDTGGCCGGGESTDSEGGEGGDGKEKMCNCDGSRDARGKCVSCGKIKKNHKAMFMGFDTNSMPYKLMVMA